MTPLCLAVRYVLAFTGHGSMHIGVFCGTWLAHYLAGLEWQGRIQPWLARHGIGARQLVLLVAAGICLQWLEGTAWYLAGNQDMATTQMRVSSAITSLCVAALLMELGPALRQRLAACRPLVRLGDLSFGVYLCHMAAITLWAHFLPAGVAPWFALEWLAVLAASAAGVAVCKRLLPRRVCGWLGF